MSKTTKNGLVSWVKEAGQPIQINCAPGELTDQDNLVALGEILATLKPLQLAQVLIVMNSRTGASRSSVVIRPRGGRQ